MPPASRPSAGAWPPGRRGRLLASEHSPAFFFLCSSAEPDDRSLGDLADPAGLIPGERGGGLLEQVGSDMGRIVRHAAIVGGRRVSGVVDSATFAASVVARHRGAGESEGAEIGDAAAIGCEVTHDAAAIDDQDSRIVDSATVDY